MNDPNCIINANASVTLSSIADVTSTVTAAATIGLSVSVGGSNPPGVSSGTTPMGYLATGRWKGGCCFAETPEGLLIIANGMDPMLRWDGLAAQAVSAGVAPPTSALGMTSSGVGNISGTYTAYTRFVDCYGNVSNLSPISADFTAAGVTKQIASIAPFQPYGLTSFYGFGQKRPGFTMVTTTGPHGLATGATVRIVPNTTMPGGYNPLVLAVVGTTAILGTPLGANGNITKIFPVGPVGESSNDGTWIITVIDDNNFILNESFENEVRFGGTMVSGASTLTYTNLPIPTDPKIARRQILRNTTGQATTYYVDVDTTDLNSTSLSSFRTDAALATQEAVPVLDDEGKPFADRYTTPPDHKCVIANHGNRMFAAVDRVCSQGMAQVTYNTATVQGVGTEWTAQFVNRFLYVVGSDQPYQITAVDVVNQVLTITSNNPFLPAGTVTSQNIINRTSRVTYATGSQTRGALSNGYYGGPTNLFATYTIRPAPAERRLIYYSEAQYPEAWPALNAFPLAEIDDEITGLMSLQTHFYILERRHIWTYTFQSDPATDGQPFLAARRGCVNNNCYAVDGQMAYLLDEMGIHAFGPSDSAISMPIQDLFRLSESPLQVNFDASEYFFAVHYPAQEVVRWFVAMSGERWPRHAIALHTRNQSFWIEEFATPITAGCQGNLGNSRRVFLGSEGRHVYAFWEGTLDGPDPAQGTVRNYVTSSTLTTLVDSQASFASTGLVGSPVVIVDGTGKGQRRVIASVSGTTLTVTQPWLTLPDTTSLYQIGGIVWDYVSGYYRFADDETNNPRRVEVNYAATDSPSWMELQLFVDTSFDPITWYANMPFEAGNGVRSQSGHSELAIDTTKVNGLVQVRIDGNKEIYTDGPRWMRIELKGVSNEDVQKVYQVTIDGVIGG